MKEAPTEATLYRNKAAAIKATESALKAIATVVDMESFMTVLLSRAGARPAFSSPIDAYGPCGDGPIILGTTVRDGQN
jgi:hypothetical protein